MTTRQEPTASDPPLRDDERLVGADRVLAVLVELAGHPDGVTLDELAQTLHGTKPTIHRALVSLRKAGLADQIGRGRYILGDEFLRLAFRNHEARPDATRVEPLLRALADEFGETAHYAVLQGTDVVYRAKVDPPAGAIRLTSTIGGRNPAYRTAVGKALLSWSITSEAALRRWLGTTALERRTPRTLTTVPALFEDLVRSRERGYAIDDQENEAAVNCVAIPVHLNGSAVPTGAVSISGLTFRTPLATLVDAVPRIRAMIDEHLGTGACGPV
ncbi:MAG TPA: IclR family transcriptional regulator [Cellulomonadaceae bacterium]|nr:IclR family transcriptional regulator [Cellulomonadaceae bacterium]